MAAPGASDARHFLSSDARYLAVLDSAQKRAGLFEILTETPSLRRVLPFATLPRGCIGHAALAWDDALLVGGNSKSGESIWCRSAENDSAWTSLPLPKKIRGKAIDGLHRIGDMLIAVDDIVTPKWIVLYRAGGDGFSMERCVELPWHTTYEQITDSFLGDSGLSLLSMGVNHGHFSSHAWLFSLERSKETARWSAGRDRDEEIASPVDRAILSAKAISEVAGHIVLACRSNGVLVTELPRPRTRSPLPKPKLLDAIELATVDSLVVPRPADGRGLFAVGVDPDGARSAVWLSAECIAAAKSGSDQTVLDKT